MSNGWKLFWGWTGFMLIVYIVASYLLSRDIVYTNFDQPVSISRDMLVVGDKPITFLAASSDFFVFRPEAGGDSITGVAAEPPLGWDKNDYFVASGDLKPGKWILENGIATFEIKSEGKVTITLQYNKAEIWVLFFLCAFCIWAAGCAIGSL